MSISSFLPPHAIMGNILAQDPTWDERATVHILCWAVLKGNWWKSVSNTWNWDDHKRTEEEKGHKEGWGDLKKRKNNWNKKGGNVFKIAKKRKQQIEGDSIFIKVSEKLVWKEIIPKGPWRGNLEERGGGERTEGRRKERTNKRTKPSSLYSYCTLAINICRCLQ